MNTLDIITKTREYLDYVEDHYKNVQMAWKEMQTCCKGMHFIYDDFLFHTIDAEIKKHDFSKLSCAEFVQYRENFFLHDGEESCPPSEFALAWEHHKNKNPHHWETWTQMETELYPNEMAGHCVHMVADWMAMGYKFGDTAREFYEKTAHQMDIPEWAVTFINEIFDNVYGPVDDD